MQRLSIQRASLIFAILSASSGLVCAGEDAASSKIQDLRVSPETILLGGANRSQQIVVTAIRADDSQFDVTHLCQLRLIDESLASVEGSQLRGVADGETKLQIEYGGLKKSTVVQVRDFESYPPVDFRNDIIPLFSKLGCNSGGCHGKQSGQNGFKLSVFGFDPMADFAALSKEARGRRIFPPHPSASLLVQKATGETPHGGGSRTEPSSADTRLLTEWIRQGMPWGPESSPRLVSLRIFPSTTVVGLKGQQQILATALYSDGSRRDVTHAANYTSNSEAIAEVTEQGGIHTGEIAGEAAITVNYMGQVAAVQILVPRPEVSGPYAEQRVNNEIDRLVWSKLRKMRIVPSDLSDDATFLRRVYLDTIGTLPQADEVLSFLADDRPNKRELVIEQVLQREEFADYWASKWADILLVDRETLGERGSYEFHSWLREQMQLNRPYDEWVRELLTATGNSGRFGPTNFYRAVKTPEEMARNVSQAFLGIRLDCAQCHHHPFERWGQEDFYGMAGFFNGVKRKKLGGSREFVYHAGHRPAKLPLTGAIVPTKPPGGEVPAKLSDGDPRIDLAKWITNKQNPWFARLAVNRLWKHFLGRGLVEPEDDLRSTNPATNEPLLAYLTEQFIEHDFDLVAVMRLILQSRVYQLSSEPNETNADDEQNFSHHLVRRLPAAILLDAICEVTGSAEAFPGMPEGTRAIQLWDNRLPSYFLDTFGRSERQSPCECGTSVAPTMAQTLHLMNAPEIEVKLSDPNGRVGQALADNETYEEIVNDLCLIALSRLPTEKEKRVAAQLRRGELETRAAEDFLWTLLNSYDFLFIH